MKVDKRDNKKIVQDPMTWTQYDQNTLEASIEDAKRGKFIPHEEAMKEFRKKYYR